MEKVKGFLALPGTFQERLGREQVLLSVGKGIGVYFFLPSLFPDQHMLWDFVISHIVEGMALCQRGSSTKQPN